MGFNTIRNAIYLVSTNISIVYIIMAGIANNNSAEINTNLRILTNAINKLAAQRQVSDSNINETKITNQSNTST